MSKLVKNVLQYVLIISVMVILVWISLENIEVAEGESKIDYILSVGSTANLSLLLLSGVLLMLGHIVRAERWKLLLDPLGNKLKLSDSLLSVLVGYFVNLVIPRGGEITRCFNLYKLNGTPVPRSIGTVVAERVVDMVFLLSFIAGAFIIELDTLTYFFSTIDLGGDPETATQRPKKVFLYGLIGAIALMAALTIWVFFYKSRMFRLRLYLRIRNAFEGIKQGLLVIFRLEKRGLFILYSALIWVFYFLMSYCVIIAFPETAHLGLMATLTIFAIGGIAMAVPLPGGTGSYHVLVPGGLVLLYGLAEDKATAFTFIFHGWQTLLVIVFGALSLFLSQIKARKISESVKQEDKVTA
jgi:uncharacterized membrane protein YbhN (UPF0104 family)